MKYKCELIRDILPLYLDEVCSEESRRAVEEHLRGCPDCSDLLLRMRGNGAEDILLQESRAMLARRAENERKRRGRACVFLICLTMAPILISFIVDLLTGGGLQWFYVAASSILFGMSVLFLPFILGTEPLRAKIWGHRGLIAMGTDTFLYVLMMLSIGLYSANAAFAPLALRISVPCVLYAWSLFLIIRYAGRGGLLKTGLCIAATAVFYYSMFTDESGIVFSAAAAGIGILLAGLGIVINRGKRK